MGAPRQTLGPDGRLSNGVLPGGPNIPGRAGRKGCASARARVKAERRRINHGGKPVPSMLKGSEKPNPKPGVKYSDAPASGWDQTSANRSGWPFNEDGSRK